MNNLMRHIKNLEILSSRERVEYIIHTLQEAQIPFHIQPIQSLFVSGENVIVDYPSVKIVSKRKLMLISAHSNKFFSSPGANDNGSGLSIVLEIILKIFEKKTKVLRPIRFVFFDREDGCIPSRLGSKEYVKQYGYSDLDFVLNIDSVGLGDMIYVEGIKRTHDSVFVRRLQQSAQREQFTIEYYDKPYYGISALRVPFFVSDHTTFQFNGFSNACSITTDFLHDRSFHQLKVREQWLTILSLYLQWILFRSGKLATKWRYYHNSLDTSEHVDNKTLERIFRVTWHTVIE